MPAATVPTRVSPIRTLASIGRISLLAAGGALALCAGAARAADDCDKIAHSTVPYEANIKVGDVDLKYQVLRSTNHMTTLKIRQLDGKIMKLENQGTFPKTMTLPDGDTATFDYSVPTDKPVYEQAPKTLEMKLKHGNDVLMNTPVEMQYFPDEKLKVGDCTYDTKHYAQITTQNGRQSRNEIWYAPDLEIGIKGVSSMKAGDQQMTKPSQATSLTTSFTPFK